jgi:hypothetical protein
MRRNGYPFVALPDLNTEDTVYVNVAHVRAIRAGLFSDSVGTRVEFSDGDTLDCPLPCRNVVQRLCAAARREAPQR